MPTAPQRDGRVLLVFPPLTHLITHPELGLPQLTAALRAAGWPVRQMDLNAELVYGELRRPERLEALLELLDEDQTRFLTSAVPYLERRVAGLRAGLRRLGGRPLDPRDATSLIRRYLDHCEVVLPRPFAHHLRLGRPRLADAAERRSFVEDLLAECRFPWILTAKVVEVCQRAFVQPASYEADAVRAAAERDDALLDPFFAERLDGALTGDVRILGLSVHSTLQLVPALRIARRVRRRAPDVHIVFGGAWCAAAAPLLRAGASVLLEAGDSVAPYESDTTLLALCEALAEGRSLDTVPGLLFRRNGSIVATEPPALVPLDRLPRPSFEGLPLASYPEQKIPFRTVRGCYWGRCRFCYHVFSETQRAQETGGRPGMSARLLEQLVHTVREAQDHHGVRELTLADNATPPAHLDQVAAALTDAGIDVRWQALVRFDRHFTPALCQRIAAAGCRELSFGLETSSPAEWKRLRKGIHRELVLDNLEACTAAGIETAVFLLDYPSQTAEDYERTLAFVCAHHDKIGRFIPLRFELGRNAPAFEDPEPFGITLDDRSRSDLSVYDLPFRAADWMSEERFRELTERYGLRFLRLQANLRDRRRPRQRRY